MKQRKLHPLIEKAVDGLLLEKWDGKEAVILQDEIIERIRWGGPIDGNTKEPVITRQDIFDKGWLNFEYAYEAVGWKVEYDKPGYNEDYPASFTFTEKRK